MEATPNSIREHPAYRYNELALHLGSYAALVAAVAVLPVYDRAIGWKMAAGDVALALLFAVQRRHLLPRVRTTGHLDLLVTSAAVPAFLMQVWSMRLAPTAESPSGVTALIVTISLLYSSTLAFLLSAFGGAAIWLIGQQLTGADCSRQDLVHLFVTAPACAMVVRLSVQHLVNALIQLTAREQTAIDRLNESVQSLTAEKQLREDSESRLYERQKVESLGLMAGGIAHDFNNVLQAITAFAEVIQITTAEPRTRETAAEVTRAAANAADICSQMLVYSGRSHERRVVTDVGELTMDLRPLLRASAKDNVALHVDCLNQEPLTIFANAGQIRQVLMNLVANAADATQPAGGTVTVTISTSDVAELKGAADSASPVPASTSRVVSIAVTDNGCGIDDSTLQQMFDPYFTTKPSGHGFGLAVVHGIVRSHDGVIHVTSTPGAGTTVTVQFPVAVSEAAEQPVVAEAAAPLTSPVTRRILIVDDEDSVRHSVSSMLTVMHTEVVTVDGAAAALELLSRDTRFDAILLDYIMPQQSGLELIRELRRLGNRTPVILCSGFVGETDRLDALDLVDGYLAKPFSSEALLAAIEEVVRPHNSD